jgi:hypothetical protein
VCQILYAVLTIWYSEEHLLHGITRDMGSLRCQQKIYFFLCYCWWLPKLLQYNFKIYLFISIHFDIIDWKPPNTKYKIYNMFSCWHCAIRLNVPKYAFVSAHFIIWSSGSLQLCLLRGGEEPGQCGWRNSHRDTAHSSFWPAVCKVTATSLLKTRYFF